MVFLICCLLLISEGCFATLLIPPVSFNGGIHPSQKNLTELGFYIHDLYGNFDDLTVLSQAWKSNEAIGTTELVQKYEKYYFLRGFTRDSFERIYEDLPVHNFLSFTVTIVAGIDTWKPKHMMIFIEIDGENVGELIDSHMESKYPKSGNFPIDVTGKITHTKNELTLRIAGNNDSPTTSFGITNVRLSFQTLSSTETPDLNPTSDIECPIGCQYCWGPSGNQCYSCKEGYSFNGGSCIAYALNCAQCTSQTECSRCSFPFLLGIDGGCRSSRDNQNAILKDTGFAEKRILAQGDNDFERMKDIAKVSNVVTKVMGVGLQIVNIISTSNIGSIASASIRRMLLYLRYSNVTYSENLQVYFAFNDPITSNMILDVILSHTIDKIEPASGLSEYPIPTVFAKYGLSSNFIINNTRELIFLGISIFFFCLFWLSDKACLLLSNAPALRLFFQKGKVISANLLIAQFYIFYGDVIFFSALELANDGSSKISQAIFFLILITGGLFILLVHFGGILRYQMIRRQNKDNEEEQKAKLKEFNTQFECLRILYESFKDGSVSSQAFLFFFMIRSILFSLFMVLLYDKESLQLTLMMILLTGTYLIFLGIRRPFKDLLELIQLFIFELLLFGVTLCCVVNLQADEGSSAINSSSDAIMVLMVIYSFLPLPFFVIKGIRIMKKSPQHAKVQDQGGLQQSETEIRINTAASNNMSVIGDQTKIIHENNENQTFHRNRPIESDRRAMLGDEDSRYYLGSQKPFGIEASNNMQTADDYSMNQSNLNNYYRQQISRLQDHPVIYVEDEGEEIDYPETRGNLDEVEELAGEYEQADKERFRNNTDLANLNYEWEGYEKQKHEHTKKMISLSSLEYEWQIWPPRIKARSIRLANLKTVKELPIKLKLTEEALLRRKELEKASIRIKELEKANLRRIQAGSRPQSTEVEKMKPLRRKSGNKEENGADSLNMKNNKIKKILLSNMKEYSKSKDDFPAYGGWGGYLIQNIHLDDTKTETFMTTTENYENDYGNYGNGGDNYDVIEEEEEYYDDENGYENERDTPNVPENNYNNYGIGQGNYGNEEYNDDNYVNEEYNNYDDGVVNGENDDIVEQDNYGRRENNYENSGDNRDNNGNRRMNFPNDMRENDSGHPHIRQNYHDGNRKRENNYENGRGNYDIVEQDYDGARENNYGNYRNEGARYGPVNPLGAKFTNIAIPSKMRNSIEFSLTQMRNISILIHLKIYFLLILQKTKLKIFYKIFLISLFTFFGF